MILKEMFDQQQKLYNCILKSKNLKGDFYKHNVIAFMQELAEFSNELRFFKYWSNKSPSSKETILEEYVDALSVLLDLGLDINKYIVKTHNFNAVARYTSLIDQYILIVKKVAIIADNRDLDMYYDLLENYLGIGMLVGFTFKEIETAYYKKNEINFNRQATGY